MFKRPTDPPEYNSLLAIPGVAAVGAYAAAAAMGHPDPTLAYAGASVACISSIATLKSSSLASRSSFNLEFSSPTC
jgi:NAD(P) transhydrogenase